MIKEYIKPQMTVSKFFDEAVATTELDPVVDPLEDNPASQAALLPSVNNAGVKRNLNINNAIEFK